MKQVFINGTILTMDGTQAECVVTENGRISFAGPQKEVDLTECEILDLEGHTLMPSFIDAHSHITTLTQVMLLADLTDCRSIGEVGMALAAYKREHRIPDTEPVIGFGYDHTLLQEERHPLASELDTIISSPAAAIHSSLHMASVNHKLLALLGVNDATPDPDGGLLGRDSDGHLTGYLEENAVNPIFAHLKAPNPEQLSKAFLKAQQIYAGCGITTVQDGITRDAELSMLKRFRDQGEIFLDIVSYIGLDRNKKLMDENQDLVGQYQNHYKVGGYKIFLDGSPQGRTAWMRQPYAGESNYCGYPICTDEMVTHYFQTALKERLQIIAHCNGDAACEQFIRCYEHAGGYDNALIRPVMIHAQFVAPDQLDRIAALQIITSFFVSHCYYWGDVHLKNFGPERGGNISPVKSALDRNIVVTFHQDTPVIRPNMLESVQCAVTRRTRMGIQLNPHERISVLEALKAVTVNAAFQYGEEDLKGTLTVGKLADMVILSSNPLKTDINKLGTIQILNTYKEGQCIYNASK